jgi:putative SOS response-associated peptidase YedK
VTFTLLTTRPSERIRRLHDRMPVVLQDAGARSTWIDPDSTPDALTGLLGPAADAYLEDWPVSTLVNRPVNEGPELVEPVEG